MIALCTRSLPGKRSLAPQRAHVGTLVEVGLDGEVVVDGGVCGEETLGGVAGPKALLLPLSSDREMKVFYPLLSLNRAG